MPHSKRLLALLAATASVLSSGCGEEPAPVTASPHGPRNRAYLHALRDTGEAYQEAIRILRGVTGGKQAAFHDWLNLARAILLLPDEDPGLGDALTAAGKLPNDRDGLAALQYIEAIHRGRQQDHGGAASLLDQVLQSHPDHPEALYQRGLAGERSDDQETARRCYQRLVAMGQLVRPAAYRLTKVTAALGDQDAQAKAIALFESRDPSEKPDTLRCVFTELSLRPHNRKESEPPLATLRFSSQPITDLPESIQQVLVLPTSGPPRLLLIGRTKIFESRAGGRPEETPIPVSGQARGLVADLGPEGGVDLLLVDSKGAAIHDHGSDGRWKAPLLATFPAATGDGSIGIPRALEAFDEDHDGDLDILLLTGGHPAQLRMLRNDGKGGFTWKPERRLPCAPIGPVQIDLHDLDQANDLDLVAPGAQQTAVLSLNLRGDRYRSQTLEPLAKREIFLVEDFDNDGAPDIFGTGVLPGFTLLRNAHRSGRRYEAQFQPAVQGTTPIAYAATAADLDNDGDLDVLLATGQGIVPLQNQAGVLTPLQRLGTSDTRGVHTADLDGDGQLEIISRHATGQVVITAVEATPRYEAIVLAPEGRKDNRGAIGTVAEVFVGTQYQSRMLKSPLGTRFGLGSTPRARVDGIKLRWPQGIVQGTPREKLDLSQSRLAYRQIEGLVASCPFLYVRGAAGWQFQTDVLGIAPLAEWLPPGGTPHLDPEEFVRIPGDRLAVRSGIVELALTEELKETTYLDRVELRFVDHDADAVLLIDENLTQGAYDKLRIHRFARGDLTTPADARALPKTPQSESSRPSCLPALERADGQYFHAYHPAPSQWSGWSPPFAYQLTTAAPADTLVMTGRLAWYDSAVAYALAQNGLKWAPLRVDHVPPTGTPKTLIANAGGPTGMDRHLVLELGGTLPAGTVLRIHSQHRFLWDQVQTALRPTESPFLGDDATRTATLEAADLYPHGYSDFLGDPATLSQSYRYEDRAPDDRYPRARGFANPYGPVTELIEEHDDRLVILVAGDAVRLKFRAPPVPADKSRTWFLRLSGWAKESGFHNATGEEIAPLPFRGMSAYPPPAGERTPWSEATEVLSRRVR